MGRRNRKKITFSDIKKKFDSLSIANWNLVGPIGENSGQAAVAEVSRISDGQKGVFRYLKRTNATDIKRFRREVRVLDDYKHTNILNILESSLDGYWYISEKGTSFQDYWIQKRSELEDHPDEIVKMAINIILNLIEGLIPLHEKGVVHRDIKHDNIVVVNDKPVLIDFGLVFHPEEERITPLNSAVGNARYSPDQMMNRLENVPAWLDVFMLIQLLIWMTQEESPKNHWVRPLDWRWVIYPENMSDMLVLKIRALTALCSDPDYSPENALALKNLIISTFTADNTEVNMDENIKKIIESFDSGQAKSTLDITNDKLVFSNTFPVFRDKYLHIENSIRELAAKPLKPGIEFQFQQIYSIDQWAEEIKQTKNFYGHPQIEIFKLHCGVISNPLAHFTLICKVHFRLPSMPNLNPYKLPEDFLPIYMEFSIWANDLNIIQDREHSAVVGIKESGELFTSQSISNISDAKKITREDLVRELESWVAEDVYWKRLAANI